MPNGTKQVDLELGLFVSEPRPIGSSGDGKRTQYEAWNKETEQMVMDERTGAWKGTYYI